MQLLRKVNRLQHGRLIRPLAVYPVLSTVILLVTDQRQCLTWGCCRDGGRGSYEPREYRGPSDYDNVETFGAGAAG
jgi:hypothetical protein